ncbi:MAG TPA: prepilin-type N-terminal cleavage/methylation domain-containing protein [Armatimonadota bacterium]|jgi:prepilin-type N-terminal cleavage/methylation domain-containing protein
MSRRAFTLIELLVVIAIIAILAAILFPVFAKARQRSIQTKCISQLKQIGTAIISYAQDNDGRLPFAWRGYDLTNATSQKYCVVEALNPYMKSTITKQNIRESIWYCTAVPASLNTYPPPNQNWAYIYYSFFAEGQPGAVTNLGKIPIGGLAGLPLDGPYTFAPFSDSSNTETFAKYHRSPAGMPVMWDQRIIGQGDAASKAAGGEFPHMNNTEILCIDGHVRSFPEKSRNDAKLSPWIPGSNFSG